MDIIRKRRSIRKFTSQKVEEKDLHKILEAAMCAPSAGNQQPWQFIVVTDQEARTRLSKTGPYTHMAAEAPVLIIVLGDLNRETHKDYWPIDCSAATQNILLEATSLGLGSVWLGVHPRPERKAYISEIFELPEHIIPFAIICIGYGAEEKGPSERFDTTRIHYEKW
ncbi:MAG: nitroreductase family protein [Bacteroidales bacterium]|nr:nitroreductase family protein [Bacteroidales bacterium]